MATISWTNRLLALRPFASVGIFEKNTRLPRMYELRVSISFHSHERFFSRSPTGNETYQQVNNPSPESISWTGEHRIALVLCCYSVEENDRVVPPENSVHLFADRNMSSEAPKAAKEAFVPKYDIAAGLHKGLKLEKFVPKRVRPTRRVQVGNGHAILIGI